MPRFVHGGCENARRALRPIISARVRGEFAARLWLAGFWKRWFLRLEMRRETARRLEEVAPSDALY